MTIRVLLADDQPLIRAGIAMLLSAEPDIETVAEVGDGDQAVAAAHRLRPDVVVMDVRMPGTDGVAATRRITGDASRRITGDASGRDPGRPVQVLILTTYHIDDTVYAALRAGAAGFLLKDAAPTELTGAIRAVAAGGGWLHPAVARGLLAEFAARPQPRLGNPAELHHLTPRERDILAHVAQGLSNGDIAARLIISEGTVKTHLGRVLMKLGLRDRSQAVVAAYESGLVTPRPRR
jgi:DNA-binding NarL/FixJ family response regulator